MNKKGKISLVFGIIGILANISIVITYSYVFSFDFLLLGLIIAYLAYFTVFFGWAIALVGVIFGVLGLKEQNKKIALAGILLGLTNLIAYCWLYWMAQSIGTQ